MRSRTPRAAGPRAVDRARSRVRRARLARSSGTPRASNARDSRAFRRVRSSSADAEASARAVARSTFASRIAPQTGIVLDDAMSAWATRALEVALGGGAEEAREDACERDALVGERAGWVSDAGGGECDEERGATRGAAATRARATTRTAGVVAVMVGVVGCAAYALYSTTGGGSTAGVARLGGEDEAELGRRWTARRREAAAEAGATETPPARQPWRARKAIDFKGSEDPSEAAWIGQPNEYVCAMRNRRRREAEFEEHAGGKWSPGCNARNENSCLKVSNSGARLALLGQHVYIICMKCDRLEIPPEWAGRVTTVHGTDVDPCYSRNGADHWRKASMSHVHAMLDAKVNGYETITIMEEDAMTKDLTAEDINVDGLLSMLNSTASWNTVRLGYRPYFFEQQAMAGGREGVTFRCPASCACEQLSQNACIIKNAGCDMRSSDFYVVRMSQANSIRHSVKSGSTIDMQALRALRKQVYVLPQVSVQGKLDRSENQQTNMANRFRQLCLVDAKTTVDNV